MVHETSSVLARLWPSGCTAGDLLPSLLAAQCSSCTSIASFRWPIHSPCTAFTPHEDVLVASMRSSNHNKQTAMSTAARAASSAIELSCVT